MSNVRLYCLNGGYIDIHDMSGFSDNQFYPPQTMRLANPCFLIQHPQGWLLWDLGLGDQYVGQPCKHAEHDVTLSVPISLADQLKQLGLTPNDIQLVALSHHHFDHMGNVNLFPHATLLIQRREYEYMQPKPDSLIGMQKILLDGDYGDFASLPQLPKYFD